MEKMKILTIIIPTYNMEKYLRKCLDSLIVSDENMQLLEVLVVNDGSKDSSSKIAHEYEAKYPQTFRVIDKENGNYGSCINRGLKEATGKYVKVLDADDSYDNQELISYLKVLTTIDVYLVLNDFNMVSYSGAVRKKGNLHLPSDCILSFKDIPADIEMWIHNVAYKTENLQKMGYKQSEGISYTDLEWIFLPMTTVSKIYYFNHPLYKYVIDREGQTMAPAVRSKSIWMIMQIAKVIIREYQEWDNKDRYIEAYLRRRIWLRLRTIYSAYIYRYKDMDVKELISFDQDLYHSNKEIYAMAEEFVIDEKWIKCHYVKIWRKDYSFDRFWPRFFYKLLCWYRYDLMGRVSF